jgi:hypothetical protein
VRVRNPKTVVKISLSKIEKNSQKKKSSKLVENSTEKIRVRNLKFFVIKAMVRFLTRISCVKWRVRNLNSH